MTKFRDVYGPSPSSTSLFPFLSAKQSLKPQFPGSGCIALRDPAQFRRKMFSFVLPNSHRPCGSLHESHVDRCLSVPRWTFHLCLTVSRSSLCFWASGSARLEFADGETQVLSGRWGTKVFRW